VRYGYRRVHIQLRREAWCHGQNKTRRIFRESGLQLRNKTPKRRVKAKLRENRRPATRSNETWAMDFVHDQLATGRKLFVLTIVDTFSRFSPALEPRFTFRGADVVEVGMSECSLVHEPCRRPEKRSEAAVECFDEGVVGGVAWSGEVQCHVLERVGRQVGFPATIRVDQGTEFDHAIWICGLISAASTKNAHMGAIGQQTPIMLLNHDGAASPPS
jgi:putative transposase